MSSTISTARPVMAEVTDIFRSVLSQPDLELTLRSTADDVCGWDSLAHISLLVEAECRFGIEFQPAEVETVQSVGELVRAIEAKRPTAA